MEKKNFAISFRITQKLKNKLNEKLEKEGISQTEFLTELVEKAIKK